MIITSFTPRMTKTGRLNVVPLRKAQVMLFSP